MALPGISNANEFYSAHYLESEVTPIQWTGVRASRCLSHW